MTTSAESEVALRAVHHDGVDRAAHHRERRDVGSRRRVPRDVHRNHDVDVHLPRRPDGHVVEEPSVHEQAAVNRHRREDPRHRHRRPHGLGQDAAAEHDALGLVDVERHAAERRRQIVEGRERGVGQREAIDQKGDALPRVQAAWQPEPSADPEFDAGREGAPILLAPERLVLERRLGRQHGVPAGFAGHGADVAYGDSRGVRPADEAAHARAGHRVDRDAVLLEPLQHADVGQAARAPAAEREADARPRGDVRGRRRLGFLGRGECCRSTEGGQHRQRDCQSWEQRGTRHARICRRLSAGASA